MQEYFNLEGENLSRHVKEQSFKHVNSKRPFVIYPFLCEKRWVRLGYVDLFNFNLIIHNGAFCF